MRKITTLVTLLFFVSCNAYSQESIFSNLDYPELQVSPRATERLAQLAELEERSGPLVEWTMLTSGAMTLFAGLQHGGKYKELNPTESEKIYSDNASKAGILVGAGWIAIGTYMGVKSWSASKLSEVKKIPAKDKRGELARERMAEEILEFASDTTATLEDLSIWTNFATSLYIVGYATEENRVYGLLAATTSFLPWLFPNPYTSGYKKHKEYKRKIYTPLVGMTFGKQLDPMMSWTWNF